MEHRSAIQKTNLLQIYPGGIHALSLNVFFFITAIGMWSPYPTWGAIYECRNSVGEIVLTDRPSQLLNCRVLVEGTGSDLTPPESATPLRNSLPPINPERPLEPPYTPYMPSNQSTDTQRAPAHSSPASTPADSSAPPPQPCSQGLNPLNPLSTPPCVRSDPSGAKPPTVPSTPSQ